MLQSLFKVGQQSSPSQPKVSMLSFKRNTQPILGRSALSSVTGTLPSNDWVTFGKATVPNKSKPFTLSHVQWSQRNGDVFGGMIRVEGGMIQGTQPGTYNNAPASLTVDGGTPQELGPKLLITPGFVSQHSHGGLGVDYNNPDVDKIIDEFLPTMAAHGLAVFYPTVMTDKEENLLVALSKLAELKTKLDTEHPELPQMPGIHLEGNIISPKAAGCHPMEPILEANKDPLGFLKRCVEASEDQIRLVTVAPEIMMTFEDGTGKLLDDSRFREFAEYAKAKNIKLSVGHSLIPDSILENLIDEGLVTGFTHMGNACNSTIKPRDPGQILKAIFKEGFSTELITDLVHSFKEYLWMVFQSSPPDDIVIVDDTAPVAGLVSDDPKNPIVFPFGTVATMYDAKQGRVVLADAPDTLAGSGHFIDECVQTMFRTLHDKFQTPFAHVVKMASYNAAKRMGMQDKFGQIEAGQPANLLMWEAVDTGGKLNYVLKKAWVNGYEYPLSKQPQETAI